MGAEDNLGTVRQPLVGGGVVDLKTQEAFGLLRVGSPSGSCSASLLRNDWAITAAHCVELPGQIADPARPGQFMVAPPGLVQVAANWGNGGDGQVQAAVQIETFRPYDIAIVRFSDPFEVGGSTSGFSRLVFQDDQFPYWGQTVPLALTIFGRGINEFAKGSAAGATPSQSDGQYRLGYAQTTRQDANRYYYSTLRGTYLAGGDSGGPSFAWGLEGYALVGVHSSASVECLDGQVCGVWAGPSPAPPGYNPWMWVTSTPEGSDSPISPVWPQISAIIGNAPIEPDPLESPLPGFIGTFTRTPPDFQPIWLYAIQPDGVLLWYRKDTGASAWQGPKPVGGGWGSFSDVIPAGGNRFYALANDGTLFWYQHDGFNDGSVAWKGPVQIGNGWNFERIFSGGNGIVYAIQSDGTLLWYSHGGYADGGGAETWYGPVVVGSSWAQFKDVFSTGEGAIYAVKDDGTLLLYQHKGFATGEPSWRGPRSVGTGWQAFRQIIPVGDGVLLAVRDDGELLWYRHLGRRQVGVGIHTRWEEHWEGPEDVGSGWQAFTNAVAILPSTPSPVR